METQELVKYFKGSAAGVDAAMRADLSSVGNARLSEILEQAIFNGGKRIRPQLTLLFWALTAGANASGPESAMGLAVVFDWPKIIRLSNHVSNFPKCHHNESSKPSRRAWKPKVLWASRQVRQREC